MGLFNSFDPERAAATSRWRRSLWVCFGLAYLLFWPASELFRHGQSTARVAFGLSALVSFAAVFVALVISNNPWSGETRRLSWVLLGIAAAMSIVYPLLLSRNWIGVPIYLGVACAMAVPPRWAMRGILGSAVLTCVLCLVRHTPGSTTAQLTLETVTTGMMLLAFRSSRILVRELHEARGEVARLAANEERLRIARDLHDLLGHTLSLIALKSEVAKRLAERDPGKNLAEVTDIETIARQALADVREAVSGYRQRSLTDELDNAHGILAAAGVDLTVTSQGTPLPDQIDGLFGWAVREGVTNVVRHARARTATIAISRQDGAAVLKITDDGGGGSSTGGGSGLSGLGERVAAWGGTLEAGTRPDGGFGLTVRAPLSQRAPSEPATARP